MLKGEEEKKTTRSEEAFIWSKYGSVLQPRVKHTMSNKPYMEA